MNSSEKISKSYYELFSTMMVYNHKIWRKMAMTLPANHCMVLYFLLHSSEHRATIAEFVEHLGISKQQMSPIVEKLQQKGFIEKRCLSKDRRYSQLVLTEKGMAFLQQNLDTQAQMLRQIITPLSDKETEQFTDNVAQIKHLVKKMFNE